MEGGQGPEGALWRDTSACIKFFLSFYVANNALAYNLKILIQNRVYRNFYSSKYTKTNRGVVYTVVI